MRAQRSCQRGPGFLDRREGAGRFLSQAQWRSSTTRPREHEALQPPPPRPIQRVRPPSSRVQRLVSLALVPYAEAMLVPLPEGVDPAVLPSAADNIPDGWRTVAPGLAELPGADVLVIIGGGMRSLPLYAVDAAIVAEDTALGVPTPYMRRGAADHLGSVERRHGRDRDATADVLPACGGGARTTGPYPVQSVGEPEER